MMVGIDFLQEFLFLIDRIFYLESKDQSELWDNVKNTHVKITLVI